MTNDFDKNGYVHLKEFINRNTCKRYTNLLKDLVNKGEATKDKQCPLSYGIYGQKNFDELLEDLLPYFEKASGKKLYPTYSYARLYQPNDELKKHTDRPACEISATLTLGFEGKPWSIYMEHNKIDMEVGDAVLYRGMDLEHWRNKYTEGQWQAQVFLHYVDADGPHADQKYDSRESLGIPKPSTVINNRLTDCAIFKNHITDSFCQNLINTYSQDSIKKEPAYIGDNNLDKNIRDVERVILQPNVGISATLAATGLNANNYWWKYNVTHTNQSEFLIYKQDGRYYPHVDTIHKHSNETRKLTVLAFLNDDYKGGKFYIQTTHKKFYPPQEKGTIIVFPSYMLHGVEPVTEGVRYSCVTWLEGPYFK